VEFKVPFSRLAEILELLKRILPGLDTVASVSLIGCSEKNGRIPLEEFPDPKQNFFLPEWKGEYRDWGGRWRRGEKQFGVKN